MQLENQKSLADARQFIAIHQSYPMNYELIQARITHTHRSKSIFESFCAIISNQFSVSFPTGDLIDVHNKQEDGWWIGAINDRVGIFPATYVEEFP